MGNKEDTWGWHQEVPPSPHSQTSYFSGGQDVIWWSATTSTCTVHYRSYTQVTLRLFLLQSFCMPTSRIIQQFTGMVSHSHATPETTECSNIFWFLYPQGHASSPWMPPLQTDVHSFLLWSSLLQKEHNIYIVWSKTTIMTFKLRDAPSNVVDRDILNPF